MSFGKRLFLTLLAFSLLFGGMALGRPLLGPGLVAWQATARPGDRVSVLIAFRDQVDNEALEARLSGKPKEERWALAVEEMKRVSGEAQRGVLALLLAEERAGRASEVRPLWIVNAIACRISPRTLEELLARDEVLSLERSEVPAGPEGFRGPAQARPVHPDLKTGFSPSVEWHVRKVGADSVWHARGFWGQNVIVALISSGVNYRHRDLKSHLWSDPNYPNHGWNFEQGTNDPIDMKGFGTHQAGVIASDGTCGDTCGVAPKSEVMALRVKTTLDNPLPDTVAENQALGAIQFAVAPPLSPTHHAHVIALAWGFKQEWFPRRALWRQALTNASQAGLVALVESGNERGIPPPKVARTPGDVPGPWKHPAEASGGLSGAITVGATDSLDDIAWFSSPGPVAWDSVAPYNDYRYPPGLLKPDLSAPGHNLTSLAYDNTQAYYPNFSGTGHSAALAAGVAALMLSKNPALLPAVVDSLLQTTVLVRGSQPKNNDYGTGRIRALGAVDAVPIAGQPQLVYQGCQIRDPLGNANGFWDPGERIGLVDTLANLGRVRAQAVTGTLRTDDPYVTLLDSTGAWGDIDSLARRANASDTFVLRANIDTPPGHLACFQLALVANGGTYRTTVFFALPIGQVRRVDPLGPDPYGYYAMDDQDTLYENRPVYQWVELDPARGGQGVLVGAGGDEVTYIWPMSPIAIKSYGIFFDSLSISSNGWIQLGETRWTWPNNAPVPSLSAPPCGLFPFWDDLRTDLGGRCWLWANSADQRMIVEWDSVALWRDTLGYAKRQSFEVILLDTALTPPTAKTRDSEILFQWKKVADSSHITVGMQDWTQTVGLQALYHGDYDPATFPIGPGRAIKFTTDPPKPKISGVVSKESPAVSGPRQYALRPALPNPSTGHLVISYDLPVEAPVSLKVYNLSGQRVKTLVSGKERAGYKQVSWDGRTEQGSRASSGVYFYRLEAGSFTATRKFVVLR